MRSCLLTCLFLLVSGTAQAADDKVTIAAIEGLADVPAGEAVIREAYSRLGIDIEIQRFPPAEALRQSNGGEVSAELQRIDGISARYENLVQVPIPINLIQGVVFSRKYRFPVTGWHSLRPYRIGIVKGILFAEVNTFGMEVSVYDDYPELMDALDRDAVDVGIMPRVEGLNLLRTRQGSEITEMEGILETLFLYHYVHKSRSGLVEQLSTVLKNMLQTGETRRLREATLAQLKDSS